MDLWLASKKPHDPYVHVRLNRCGFMSLGTPHRGSQHANNVGRMGNVLLKVSRRRKDIFKALRVSNEIEQNHLEIWLEFSRPDAVGQRPFVCFAEDLKTSYFHGVLSLRVSKSRQSLPKPAIY